jgi:hypothetical protein
MAREKKKRTGDSAYSKCKTVTAGSSDRDDSEKTDAKNSPGENDGNEFGRSAHKKKGRSQQSY